MSEKIGINNPARTRSTFGHVYRTGLYLGNLIRVQCGHGLSTGALAGAPAPGQQPKQPGAERPA